MNKLAIALSLFVSPLMLFADDTPAQRLADSAQVFREIMATPDKGIPQELLETAHCVVIVPGMKQAGFVVGAKYGRGFVVCRAPKSGWEAPEAIRIEGGSLGFQIGASSTDVVMLVMNERGMRRLQEDKFTLGAEASVAAGPVGRKTTAETDVQLSAEILSWSRSKGLFAGVALTGATLRPDNDVNKELYGRKLTAKEILTGGVHPPAAAKPLVSELSHYSFREEKSEPLETRAAGGPPKKK